MTCRAAVNGAAWQTCNPNPCVHPCIHIQVELLRDPSTGIEFVIRLSSALASKPKGQSALGKEEQGGPSSSKPPPRNPFLPYEEALWVEHLSPTHTLLLNKVPG